MPDLENILQTKPRAIYSAFDLFPSRKGAAIHINRFARALFEEFGGGLLHVLGNDKLPSYQLEGNIEVVRFDRPIGNYLRRALAFSDHLANLIADRDDRLELCHFRDIWSGLSILSEERRYKTIFETNGFPSIELPFAYRQMAPETLGKLRDIEDFCLRHSDRIITPSRSIRDLVVGRGADPEKVTVIPNGADIPETTDRPAGAPNRYIIYFGAVQAWQGVEVLLRAFARLRDLTDLSLVICSSNHSRRSKMLRKLAEKLEVDGRILWHYGLGEKELAGWLEGAELSVAPLTECSRNVEQGCSPLKILESMAAGVPVVASDLPSVREVIDDGVEGRLVAPDRPGELARTIRVLLQYPDHLRELGNNGVRRVRREFLWDRSIASLKLVYRQVLGEEGP